MSHRIRGRQYDETEWMGLDPVERQWEEYENMNKRDWGEFALVVAGVIAFWVVLFFISVR